MKEFFTNLMRWMDRTRRVLVNGLFLLMLIILTVAIFATRPSVPDGAALILDLKGALVEEMTLPAPGDFPFGFAAPVQTRMQDLLDAINDARDDERIRVLVLKLDELQRAPLAKLQDLRHAIEAFKEAGKIVVASGANFSQSQYYLAATANKVFLHPMGIVALTGFGIYRNYFKDALDRMHINVTVFRAGDYKSAVEPFVRNDMSDMDREANRAWLEVLWRYYKEDVAAMRGIRPERLQAILDHPGKYLQQHGGSIAELARAEGLVDAIADAHGVRSHIAGILGQEEADQDYPSIHYRDYLRAVDAHHAPESDQLVAVIAASGPILDGEQPAGMVGSETLADMLRQARLDEQIKAVVLRVDSPGGSALASEAIRREVLRVREAGKPVVVSMGSVAASGGYWVAAAADEIWAAPTTLTGSIGVFGLFGDIHQGLHNLGIHTDGLGTTEIAGGLRVDRPMNSKLAKAFQLSVDDIYRRFLDIVAEGRDIPISKTKALAQGRVWSGVDAKNNGLVDHLGDLEMAVEAAAVRAGISDDYDKIWIRPAKGFAELLAEQLFGEAAVQQFTAGIFGHMGKMAVWHDALQWLSRLKTAQGIYAYCEYSGY